MAEPRTLAASTWLATIVNNPQTPEAPLTKMVLDALASVKEPHIGSAMIRARHWPRSGESTFGAMWLGVVNPTYAYRDAGGCWVLQTFHGGEVPAPAYMRLVPAGDAEVQYGFCPLKLDRRESMLQALFPDGKCRLNTCSVRTESSTYIRIDKMAITAARLQDADTDEGAQFRRLLGRLRIPLGDFIEDLFRNVYSDRVSSVLSDRSDDYRDIVHLMVAGSYPTLFPPAAREDINRFLSCVIQDPPHFWSLETVFPSLGSIVLPDDVCAKVSRNLEAGLPPIVPQWCTAYGYQFNGPWARPCTGIESGGRDCKILAGVCNVFNTDLMGPLCYWPPDWHPHEDWVSTYMDVLDEVHSMAMPVDVNHRTDLLLDTARRVPVILQETSGPTYARVVSFEVTASRGVSDIVIRPSGVTGERLLGSGVNPVVETLPDSSPDQEAEDVAVGTEMEECEHCNCESDGFSRCGECGQWVCDDCWSGECEDCSMETCSACAETHGCEENNDE